jgi:hypothetical protein
MNTKTTPHIIIAAPLSPFFDFVPFAVKYFSAVLGGST